MPNDAQPEISFRIKSRTLIPSSGCRGYHMKEGSVKNQLGAINR